MRTSPTTSRSATLLALAFCLVAETMLAGADRDANVSPEYKLKAAFLFHFTKFVQWPSSAFADEKSPLVIGILGHDPFGDVLGEIIKGRSVNGRELVIRRSARIEELGLCHVLFISVSENDRLAQILARVRNTTELTVGESDAFLGEGGMIRLVMQDNKVRFEVNPDAAERSGLRISSQLIELAMSIQREAN